MAGISDPIELDIPFILGVTNQESTLESSSVMLYAQNSCVSACAGFLAVRCFIWRDVLRDKPRCASQRAF